MASGRKYVKEGENLLLGPGQYGKARDGNWYGCAPNGFLANLRGHNVQEHEDGTITVTPSISITNGVQTWHGYLTGGIWKEC